MYGQKYNHSLDDKKRLKLRYKLAYHLSKIRLVNEPFLCAFSTTGAINKG